MTSRKRNEFLDPVSSDEEGNEPGYDSEAAEETKGRAMKRRRMDPSRGVLDNDEEEEEEEEDQDEGESDDEDTKISRAKGKGQSKKSRMNRDGEDEDEEGSKNDDDDDDDKKHQYLDTTTKPLKSKPLDKTKPPKKNKTGVIYFSSLPPYLRPFALKSMLEKRGFAPITKVFLSPAVPSPSAPRRRSNKRKTYTDGWVEFASKKTAKICAETLNASLVGGKKGGWYHDDVWNMRYLRGFKWGDLMEQVQRERSEREARQRIEDTRARKEEKVFVSGVEKGRVLDGMERKNEEKRNRNRRRQLEQQDENASQSQSQSQSQPQPQPQPQKKEKEGDNVRRLFKQNEVKKPRDRIKGDEAKAALGDDTKRVLGKIF